MRIHEAINDTTREKPCIRRKAWEYPTAKPEVAVKILPTNSPDCCVVLGVANKNPRKGWQPTAEDLVAEDWETVRM